MITCPWNYEVDHGFVISCRNGHGRSGSSSNYQHVQQTGWPIWPMEIHIHSQLQPLKSWTLNLFTSPNVTGASAADIGVSIRMEVVPTKIMVTLGVPLSFGCSQYGYIWCISIYCIRIIYLVVLVGYHIVVCFEPTWTTWTSINYYWARLEQSWMAVIACFQLQSHYRSKRK